MNIFTKLGCYLIGWNPKILKDCGEASHRMLKRYISAVVILVMIWGAIGFCFAERYIGIESILGKMTVSAAFIAVIICIERFIILVVGKPGMTGVFRIILAFMMAVLGSAVFDQIIFHQDIDVKMKEVRTEQINKEIPKRMSYLDSDINKLTLLIDSIGEANISLYEKLSKNPVIAATNVSTTTRENGKDANGNPNIERINNVTKINVENPLNGQVKSNEAALTIYQNQLKEYQQRKITVADEVRAEYEKSPVGFLEELKALISILEEDIVALIFYIFLFGFLLSLELLVVTSKNGDSQCDYDLIVEHQLNIKKETLNSTEKRLIGSGKNDSIKQ